MLALRCLLVLLARLMLFATPARAAEAAPAPPMGVLAGAVAWAGSTAEPGLDLGDLHAFDIEGHPEVTAGLEHAVVIAEPLDAVAKSWLRTQREVESALAWNPTRASRVAATAPEVPLRVSTDTPLRFFLGDKLLQTLPAADESPITLPSGIIRVLDAQGHVGWVYVTPHPSGISHGNCRFRFRVPQGHYRLRAWHPRLGEQQRVVRVDGRTAVPLQLLIFRPGKRGRGRL